MRNRTFVEWSRTSALGHVALFEIAGVPPMALIFCALFYFDGTLTLNWAMYTVFVCAVGMAATGLLLWFFMTGPRAKRK